MVDDVGLQQLPVERRLVGKEEPIPLVPGFVHRVHAGFTIVGLSGAVRGLQGSYFRGLAGKRQEGGTASRGVRHQQSASRLRGGGKALPIPPILCSSCIEVERFTVILKSPRNQSTRMKC
jgi:hypothetical protein